jgi:phosphatidylglycerophosphate synthase
MDELIINELTEIKQQMAINKKGQSITLVYILALLLILLVSYYSDINNIQILLLYLAIIIVYLFSNILKSTKYENKYKRLVLKMKEKFKDN